LDKLIDTLVKKRGCVHYKINQKGTYIIFGEICINNKLLLHSDGITHFKSLFIEFMMKHYGIIISTEDIKYTKSMKRTDLYYFTIPKYYCSCIKIKEIMHKFSLNCANNELLLNINTTMYNCVFLQYPNQLINNMKGTEYKIIVGSMLDFIVENIPKKSTNIDYYKYNNNYNSSNLKKRLKRPNNTLNNDFMTLSFNDDVNTVNCSNITLIDKKINILNEAKKLYDLGLTVTSVLLKENNKGKKFMAEKPHVFNNINRENCLDTIKNDHNCLVLMTGIRSNVMTIDIDNKCKDDVKNGLDYWNKLIDKHGDIQTWNERTGNDGLHYHFKYDDRTKNFKTKSDVIIKGQKYSIDVRNEKGLVYIPPTYYDSKDCKKNYAWINTPYDTPLATMPDWLYNELYDKDNIICTIVPLNKQVVNKKVVTKKIMVKQSDEDILNDNKIYHNLEKYPTQYVKNILSSEAHQYKFKKILKDIVMHLNKNRNLNYGEWVELGMLLVKFGDYGIQLWKLFSKQCNDYCESEIDKKFHTFSLDSGLFLPNIMKWLRYDNRHYYVYFYQKHRKILNKFCKYNDNIVSIFRGSQYDMAKFFCENSEGKFIFSGKSKKWFMWDVSNSCWNNATKNQIILEITKEFDSILRLKIVEVTLLGLIDEIHQLTNLLKKITSVYNITNILTLCEPLLQDEYFEDCLDYCPHTVNFKNGLVDLKTGKFRPRLYSDKVCKFLPFDYNSNCNNDLKKKIIKIVSNISNDDDKLIEFNLNWLGYCLTGDTSRQKVFVYCWPYRF
jgi:hypothetical protein